METKETKPPLTPEEWAKGATWEQVEELWRTAREVRNENPATAAVLQTIADNLAAVLRSKPTP